MKHHRFGLAVLAIVAVVAVSPLMAQQQDNQQTQHWSDACKLSAACNAAQTQFAYELLQKGQPQKATAVQKQAVQQWQATQKFFQQQQAGGQKETSFHKACADYYQALQKYTHQDQQQGQADVDKPDQTQPQQAGSNKDLEQLAQIIQINGWVQSGLEGYKLQQSQDQDGKQQGQQMIQQAQQQIKAIETDDQEAKQFVMFASKVLSQMNQQEEKRTIRR